MKKILVVIAVAVITGVAVLLRNGSVSSSKSAQSTTIPSSTSGSSAGSSSPGSFKNGTYDGSTEDAFYGNLQVQVVVSGGKLSKINILQYPNDAGNSIRINQKALPILENEAITTQSSSVDAVSGASDSSQAFNASLAHALQKAS